MSVAAEMPTYVVGWDEGDFIMPLAATLTKANADRIVVEVVEGLVQEARKRWEDRFKEEPEIRPFDADQIREEARQRVAITNWEVPFVETDRPVDPRVREIAIECEDEYGGGELFLP